MEVSMATKNKQRTKRGAAALLQQVQRSLEKGDFKQALKDAKVCHRQEPGPETRHLLERAYLARGRQLHRAGLREESQAVLENLLQLGVTDASVDRELPELLIAAGLFGRTRGIGKAGPPLEDGDPLCVVVADHAVLRPEEAPASLPAIRQGAATIRRALTALEAGSEAEAVALLSDIPHASPFAEWKYFVRGLAAYYREDAAAMQANWERLDAARLAARIAAPLKALADPAAAADSPRMAPTLARLGRHALGGPVLDRLQKLQDHLLAGRSREAVKLLRASGPLFGDVDPSLPQRLVAVLYASFARKGIPAAVRELATTTGPLPVDPHWNRGLAMAWEHCEDDELSQVERHWRAYLEDLAHLECLSPTQRTLAQALVWLRLGTLLAEESHPICPTCGVCHEPDEDMQRRAVACFESSLKSAPDLLKAYRALANVFTAWGEPKRAAATCRRLVKRFPEDLDGLLFLANYHSQRDEPLAARDFIFRAQRLRPLDGRIKAMVRGVHLASARHHALAARWDEGRAEFAAAEQVGGPHAEAYRLLVHRAALELKAGDFGLAFRLFDQAGTALGESAPVWLLAIIEGARYDLPEGVVAQIESRWLAAMKKGRRSLAAGEMCRTMTACLESGAGYPGREGHVESLVRMLQRCSRIKWLSGDLRSVVEFLISLDHHEEERGGKSRKHSGGAALQLAAKLAAKARAKFPDNAFFHMVAGQMEMRKGPRRCNRRLAKDCFQRAVQLTEGAKDPDDLQIAKSAKEKLLFFEELEQGRVGDLVPEPFATADPDPDVLPDLPEIDDYDGPPPSGGGSLGGLFQMFAQVCREAGVDPEEILGEIGGGRPFRFSREDGPKRTRKNRK
jgi:tetratricopeptide (TPR) repeat protein